MARIREVDPLAAPPEIRKAFEEQLTTDGQVLNSGKISAHRPTIYFANAAFGRAIDESGLLGSGCARSSMCGSPRSMGAPSEWTPIHPGG